jgi:hypothetical protein
MMRETQRCPKCGGTIIAGPRYCGGVAPCVAKPLPEYPLWISGRHHPEHLFYTCIQCGYADIEPCADAKAAS